MAVKLMTGSIDVYEAHDYPIILGDSLKDSTRARSKHVQLRYNWEPANGFRKSKGNLKQNENEIKLSYHEDGSAAPISTYQGFHSSLSRDKDEKEMSRFVLILDESKSAFVLEKVSSSIDLNVTAAAELTKDDIRKQRLLRRSPSDESVDAVGKDYQHGTDEGDPSNPFDFRHFLSEARELMEKQQSGSRTPLPGTSTPMALVSSPSLNTGRFTNTTALVPTASSKTSKKPPTSQPLSRSKTTRKGPTKRKELVPPKSSQPLSKERISDSDEELSDAVSVEPAPSRGHTRNQSSTSGTARLNNIVFSEGGLEIDGGSPPQEPRKRYKIDAEAFRSQTQTPVLGTSSHRRSPPRTHDEDIIMRDADQSDDDDGDNDDGEEDDDVERLELDEERSKRGDLDHQPPPVETPPAAAQDDDDDELLAAVMEALEEDEEESAEGNRGINGYGHVNDDESEISEEE